MSAAETEWIDPNVDLEGHLRVVKYPKVRAICQLLAGAPFPALHIEGPVFDRYYGTPVYFNDITVMVKESDAEQLVTRLKEGGWFPVVDLDRDEVDYIEPASADVAAHDLQRPDGPHCSWVDALGWPARLWLNWQTTARHIQLPGIDLAGWFAEPEELVIMQDTRVQAAPHWGLVLCFADRCFWDARTHALTLKHWDLLRRMIVYRALDWPKVLAAIQDYTAQREKVLAQQAVTETLSKVTKETVRKLEEEAPGARETFSCEVYHVFRALEDASSGTIPASVLDALKPPDTRRVLGIPQRAYTWRDRYSLDAPATEVMGLTDMGIYEQITKYGDCPPMQLSERSGRVQAIGIWE
jgi:hypothetical protein